jgi:hypothetical protein
VADQLYLSLWYPNFRLEALPAALEKVMEQFAAVGGSARVSAATVYPISWNETPTWQRVYRNETDDEESSPRAVIAAAMENAHEDYAWEFELIWELWVPEQAPGLDTMWRHEPRVVGVVGFGPAFDEGAYETNVKPGSEDDVNAIGTRNIGGRGLGNWYSTDWEIASASSTRWRSRSRPTWSPIR